MEKLRPHPELLDQKPHFDRSGDFTHTFKFKKCCSDPFLFHLPLSPCPGTDLHPFSMEREQYLFQEPDPAHQAPPSPILPGVAAVSRATGKSLKPDTPLPLISQWLPITPNHIQAPWPSTLHSCQSFSLSSACYSLAWTLRGNTKHRPPGICTGCSLSLECPLSPAWEAPTHLQDSSGKCPPKGSPSYPPRASLGLHST